MQSRFAELSCSFCTGGPNSRFFPPTIFPRHLFPTFKKKKKLCAPRPPPPEGFLWGWRCRCFPEANHLLSASSNALLQELVDIHGHITDNAFEEALSPGIGHLKANPTALTNGFLSYSSFFFFYVPPLQCHLHTYDQAPIVPMAAYEGGGGGFRLWPPMGDHINLTQEWSHSNPLYL